MYGVVEDSFDLSRGQLARLTGPGSVVQTRDTFLLVALSPVIDTDRTQADPFGHVGNRQTCSGQKDNPGSSRQAVWSIATTKPRLKLGLVLFGYGDFLMRSSHR